MTQAPGGTGRRLRVLTERLRTSYWFTPAVMMAGSALLALGTLTLDDAMDLEENAWLRPFVFSGGPDGAREVLAVIAGSMIGVAGVVFSITIVSLQLASSQFGPRMLANFMRDRGNQITLGTFISSFLYSLLVLRTIRSADVTAVPHVSVTVGLLLAVAGLSVLVYFIHHIATTIQAPNLVDAIAGELRDTADQLFPGTDGLVHGAAAPADRRVPADVAARSRTVPAGRAGYVQHVGVDDLVALATEHDLVLRLRTRAGRFVVPGSPYVDAGPGERVDDALARRLAGTLVTGASRTAVQDVEFPIRQLVEIAVRALSPGINDPFTAGNCIDQIGGGLCLLAGREMPSPAVEDGEGALRLVVDEPVTFERLVGVSFDQVRQAADSHTAVYVHLLEALGRVAAAVRDVERLDPLLDQGRLVRRAAERAVPDEADRASVRTRFEALEDACAARRETEAATG